MPWQAAYARRYNLRLGDFAQTISNDPASITDLTTP